MKTDSETACLISNLKHFQKHFLELSLQNKRKLPNEPPCWFSFSLELNDTPVDTDPQSLLFLEYFYFETSAGSPKGQ